MIALCGQTKTGQKIAARWAGLAVISYWIHILQVAQKDISMFAILSSSTVRAPL